MDPRVKTARASLFGCAALLAATLMACSTGETTQTVSAISTPTNTPQVVPAATLTPTRTPTPVIVAVEQTPSPGATRTGGVVWDVVITSKTSRQFFDLQKGTLLNTCLTNWKYSIFYVVSPNGALKGHGAGATQTPLSCTPHPLPNSSLVTTEEEVTVEGSQDAQTLSFMLGVTSVKPNPSGDDGGMVLLFNSAACPPVRRTIQLPVNNRTQFQAQLTFKGQLTGCAGSGKDLVQADTVFDVERDFDCASVPPNFDQQIIDLCR